MKRFRIPLILAAIPAFLAIVAAVAFFVIYILQPVFLQRLHIQSLLGLQIPRTATIVERQFRMESGLGRFFIKLELTQNEHNILRRSFYFNNRYTYMIRHVEQQFNYNALSVDDIAEIGYRYRLTRRTVYFFAGTSKNIEALLVTTTTGEHFIYIFY